MESFAANAVLYRARLSASTKCFEPEDNLTGTVHVVDVPACAKSQSHTQASPVKHEFASLKSLEDFLGNTSAAEYDCRFM